MAILASLDLNGYGDRPLPNRYITHSQPSSCLALMLPGKGYSVEMPFLYYATHLLIRQGIDVLQLRPDYSQPDFEKAGQEQQSEWLYSDASAGLSAALAEYDYRKVLLIGKSLGTLSMSLLMQRERVLASAITVWMTPLLKLAPVAETVQHCKAPALFMLGTADEAYDAHILAHILAIPTSQAWVAKGADHSLEIPDDPFRSLTALEDGMHSLSTFLEQVL